jgi:hypothetical protein
MVALPVSVIVLVVVTFVTRPPEKEFLDRIFKQGETVVMLLASGYLQPAWILMARCQQQEAFFTKPK